MRRALRRSLSAGLLSSLAFSAALSASPAFAQSPWLPRDKDTAVMVEMLRPNIEGLNSGVFSAAYFLNGRFSVSDRLALVAEIPYVRIDKPEPYSYVYYYYYGDQHFRSIGNPYVGIETKSATSPIFFEAGGRLPVASKTDYFTLFAARATDQLRREGFWPEAPAIQTAINLRETSERHVAYRLRLAPVVSFPEGGPDDVEASVHYSIDIGYVGTAVRIGTEMSGSALLNRYYYGNSNLGARTATQVDVHGDFLSGPIRPGLGVRLPLGGTGGQFPVVFGVTLAWVR